MSGVGGRRLTTAAVAATLAWAVIAARAFDVQVLHGGEYRAAARDQQESSQVRPARRGGIYDRNLRPLATNLSAVSLFADPGLAGDRRALADAIARATGGGASHWRLRLESGSRFVWVARKLDDRSADRLRRQVPELCAIPEARRFYPHGPMLAHLLGGCDVDQHGLEGVERVYDSRLAGVDGTALVLRSGSADKYPSIEVPIERPQDGGRVVLTIDSEVQAIVEDELSAAVGDYGCGGGSALLADPFTGEILAWAVAPSFDVNDPGAYPADVRRNRAVTDVFEPGSTFKVVAVAAALESGAAAMTDVVECGMGKVTIGGAAIHDHKPYPRLTVGEVLAYSSNVGAIRLAQRAGAGAFRRTVIDFGFGQPTNVGFSGEARGILPQSFDDPFTLATSAIGQGVAVTPVQLLSAYGAIANGGVLMRPYAVRAVVGRDGQVLEAGHPDVVRRVISPATAMYLTEGLTMVVDSGTATMARVAGLPIAGKTGTAQVASPDGRGYVEGAYVASFAGFFPADDPRYVGLVVLDQPKGDHYGGATAAPAFARIARRVSALELAAARAPVVHADLARGPGESVRVPDVRGLEPQAAVQLLAVSGLSAETPSSAVAEQNPRSGRLVARGTSVSLITARDDGRVPDVRGLPARAACARLLGSGCVPWLSSGGVVASQTPSPGSPIPADRVCRLTTTEGS